MEQLTKAQTAVFLVGALLLCVGAGLYSLRFAWAAYIFAAGVLAFVSMQMLQRYEGASIVIRRLRRIVLLSDFLFLATALLMFANNGNPLGLDYLTYVKYVHNNWVVTLLVAAVLQLYTTHRIDQELKKEAKKL